LELGAFAKPLRQTVGDLGAGEKLVLDIDATLRGIDGIEKQPLYLADFLLSAIRRLGACDADLHVGEVGQDRIGPRVDGARCRRDRSVTAAAYANAASAWGRAAVRPRKGSNNPRAGDALRAPAAPAPRPTGSRRTAADSRRVRPRPRRPTGSGYGYPSRR